jgi:hypothetical protein
MEVNKLAPKEISYISDSSSDGDSDDERGVIEPTSADEKGGPGIETDSDFEDGAHIITSNRRAARKATNAMYKQAQEEATNRSRNRRVQEAMDMGKETDSDVEGVSFPITDDPNGIASHGGNGEHITDTSTIINYNSKVVRILHPDDEPKRRGRPQVILRQHERYVAPAKKDGCFIATILTNPIPLENISNRLIEGTGSLHFPNMPKDQFDIGAHVLVQNSANGILWDATIIGRTEGKDVGVGAGRVATKPLFLVRFDRWGANYDQWVPAHRLAAPTDTARIGRKYRKARSVRYRSREQYAKNENFNFPEPISQLRAAAVLEDMDMQGIYRIPINFSDARADNPLGMLRIAMLVVDAALPEQSKDENEEKWGKGTSFSRCWREAVAQAKDPTDLMCALMMFEFSLKASWVKPTGLKLMGCMPSRNIVSRRATIGLVAARLWALDATIRYEKNMELEDTGKNVATTDVRKDRYTYHGKAPQAAAGTAIPILELNH